MWPLLLLFLLPPCWGLNFTATYSERYAENIVSANLEDTKRATYQFLDVSFSEDVFLNGDGGEFCTQPCNSSGASCAVPVSSCALSTHRCLSLGAGTQLFLEVSLFHFVNSAVCRSHTGRKSKSMGLLRVRGSLLCEFGGCGAPSWHVPTAARRQSHTPVSFTRCGRVVRPCYLLWVVVFVADSPVG